MTCNVVGVEPPGSEEDHPCNRACVKFVTELTTRRGDGLSPTWWTR